MTTTTLFLLFLVIFPEMEIEIGGTPEKTAFKMTAQGIVVLLFKKIFF